VINEEEVASVCNEVTLNDGLVSTANTTDAECVCPDGYYYCPLSGTCLRDGETCGDNKKLISDDGTQATYQIDGFIPV
jgi:hypothetical protein